MAQQKIDGVIEVVRYTPAGQVDLVRLYERRGTTYSDRLLWSRAELVEQLKADKKIFTGERTILLASTFVLKSQVRLARSHTGEVVTTAKEAGEHDFLEGAPIF
jgi:hypothetical protein